MSWFGVVGDLWGLVRERRRWALLPLIIVLLLMSAFILAAEVPVLTPFIYALF